MEQWVIVIEMLGDETMHQNLLCFFRMEFPDLPGVIKAAECLTTHFPNVRVHWHVRIKPCSKVAHHRNGFDCRCSNCNLVHMNLGHLLTGSYDYKLGLSVTNQKTVREHPSTDINNTILNIPQRSILRHRWVWPKRKIGEFECRRRNCVVVSVNDLE